MDLSSDATSRAGMPRRFIVPTLLTIAAGLAAGCSSPKMRYAPAVPEDYNLKSGQIVFAMRASDVTFKASKAEVNTECKLAGRVPTDAEWAKCLNTIDIIVTPTIGGSTVYRAQPADKLPFVHTKLAATSLNDELPNIDIVTVAFSDDTSQFITSVGAGATGGLAFGPWGAAFGGIIGGLGAAASSEQINQYWIGPKVPKPKWQDLVCDDSYIGAKHTYLLDPASIEPSPSMAPFVIKNPRDADTCWHAIPVAPALSSMNGKITTRWSGWLYKLVLNDVPLGGEIKPGDSYFNDEARDTFPYTPCQNAEIQITWGLALMNSVTDTGGLGYRAFPIRIANPKYRRLAQLPKGGTIKLGAVCDAQLTFGSYAGSTAQTDVDAFLKQITSFKAAQDKAQDAAK